MKHIPIFGFICVATVVANPQFFPKLQPFGAVRQLGEIGSQIGGQINGQIAQRAQQAQEALQNIPIPTKLPNFENFQILPNIDCGCTQYEDKAKECEWPDQKCNILSASYLNYLFWCNSLNRFREAKRFGLIKNTYVQNLTCQSNLSLLQRELTQLGLAAEPDKAEPLPLPAEALPTADIATPSTINWSPQMSSVRNQGECASCYAFASVALCEWHLRKSGENISLSEQYLVDCDELDKGCNGGWPSKTLKVMENGIAKRSAYEYKGKKSDTCDKSSHDTSVKCPKAIEEYYPKGNDTRLRQLLARGPVVGAIHVNEDLFQYADGLYTTSNCTGKLNHAVVITGYGEEVGKESPKSYWIVRNSWGTKWGTDEGHVYIYASVENICNLSKWFWYYSAE